MNVFVAIFALDVVDEVGACGILRSLLLVAAIAGDRFGLFCLLMGFEICDIPMAAITGVGPMNGLCKLFLTDVAAMATQTFRVVNAFVTVLPALDDQFLHLRPGFRRVGRNRGFGVFFSGFGLLTPEHSGD